MKSKWVTLKLWHAKVIIINKLYLLALIIKDTVPFQPKIINLALLLNWHKQVICTQKCLKDLFIGFGHICTKSLFVNDAINILIHIATFFFVLIQ